jgi:hypothetical protein
MKTTDFTDDAETKVPPDDRIPTLLVKQASRQQVWSSAFRRGDMDLLRGVVLSGSFAMASSPRLKPELHTMIAP